MHEFVVDKDPVVDPVVREVMNCADSFPENVKVGGVSEVDVQADTSSWELREGLDGNREDDCEGRGTSALESPEEVGIVLRVDGPEVTCSS